LTSHEVRILVEYDSLETVGKRIKELKAVIGRTSSAAWQRVYVRSS
jgi:hypothetical protein